LLLSADIELHTASSVKRLSVSTVPFLHLVHGIGHREDEILKVAAVIGRDGGPPDR
jgi:hypothetical protein